MKMRFGGDDHTSIDRKPISSHDLFLKSYFTMTIAKHHTLVCVG